MKRLIRDDISLKGKISLITGAAGNLGKVFANTLGELESNLILLDLPSTDLKSIASTLKKEWKIEVDFYFCDLGNALDRKIFFEKIKSKFESINILINNAALVGSSNISGWSVPFEKQSLETWQKALDINLTAIFDIVQNLTPLLRKSNNGSVINISSIYGQRAPDWKIYQDSEIGNPAAYSASKGGLVQLSKWLASTLGPTIRVNTIAPGGILTSQPKEFVKRYSENTIMQRMANAEDIRGAVVYLGSDLSRYVTGQVISVDGGWLL